MKLSQLSKKGRKRKKIGLVVMETSSLHRLSSELGEGMREGVGKRSKKGVYRCKWKFFSSHRRRQQQKMLSIQAKHEANGGGRKNFN